jgi:hypothetical protein
MAAFVGLMAALGFDQAGWDSAALLLHVLAFVAGTAAMVMLFPPRVGRGFVSLFILFHFGGILTAVTAVSAGWMPEQLWTRVYRPYLQFMNLTDPFKYYAPDPGPTSLLWFRVEYEPGPDRAKHVRWLKVPDDDRPNSAPDGKPCRPDGTVIWPHVEYTRRLELAESVNFQTAMSNSRDYGATQLHRLAAVDIIPLRPGMPLGQQFRPPGVSAKRWLSIYARFAARTFKCEALPELKVKSVKIWLVAHEILSAKQIVQGHDPNSPTTYSPYYMGEFDGDGRLMKSCEEMTIAYQNAEANVPADPLLYWLIPIMEVPKAKKKPSETEPAIRSALHIPDPQAEPREMELINYVMVQTGDSDGRIGP